jgi:hypothetical protein
VGRHRPDPRGHARIIVAIAAVALALALLVIGGFALLGALTSGPADTVSSSSTPTAVASRRTTEPTSGANTGTGAPTLQIRVVGAPTKVYVAVPGSAPSIIRQNGVLNTGEVRRYDDAALDVVVSNGAAVQVTINGVPQTQGASGQTQRWTNVRKS